MAQVKQTLKKTNHYNGQLYCLFAHEYLATKHSLATITTNFISSPHTLLENGEIAMPLNSLINANYRFCQPLMMKMIDNDQGKFLKFFESLRSVYLKPHTKLLKQHHLSLSCLDEHLLLVIKDNQVTKVIHRMPVIKQHRQWSKHDLETLKQPIHKILSCYLNHSGNKTIYSDCRQKLWTYGY